MPYLPSTSPPRYAIRKKAPMSACPPRNHETSIPQTRAERAVTALQGFSMAMKREGASLSPWKLLTPKKPQVWLGEQRDVPGCPRPSGIPNLRKGQGFYLTACALSSIEGRDAHPRPSQLSEGNVYTGGLLPSLVAFRIRAPACSGGTVFSLHGRGTNPNSTTFQPTVYVHGRFLMEHRCCLLHADPPSLEFLGDSSASRS